MLNAELASLPDTPENAQRIQELNNALVTLDQRMKNIMGDALLWVDQTGVDAPPKATVARCPPEIRSDWPGLFSAEVRHSSAGGHPTG